jgi:hypothetical protein
MNTLSLVRTHMLPEQTKGELFVLDENAQVIFQCYTLELPWKDNQQNISCIPPGRYAITPRWSKKYKDHIHILDVPGREWILIHEANFVSQLRGCIAVGRARIDINGDGLKDVTSSIATKMQLVKLITGPSQIIIRNP